jgi:hypothetical protein
MSSRAPEEVLAEDRAPQPPAFRRTRGDGADERTHGKGEVLRQTIHDPNARYSIT